MSRPDFNTIDISKGVLVAQDGEQFAQKRGRWTEMALYYFAEPLFGGYRYVLEVSGRSSIKGERTFTKRIGAGTLDRALRELEHMPIWKNFILEARTWDAERRASSGMLNDSMARAKRYADIVMARPDYFRVGRDVAEQLRSMSHPNISHLNVPANAVCRFMGVPVCIGPDHMKADDWQLLITAPGAIPLARHMFGAES